MVSASVLPKARVSISIVLPRLFFISKSYAMKGGEAGPSVGGIKGNHIRIDIPMFIRAEKLYSGFMYAI
jgi:hypothetical protein